MAERIEGIDVNYPPDPGGVFDSDTHRRVLGHLPLPGDDPTTVEALADRLAPDDHTEVDDGDELDDVLQNLEADSHAGKTAKGWKQTKAGLDALSGPNANEPKED